MKTKDVLTQHSLRALLRTVEKAGLVKGVAFDSTGAPYIDRKGVVHLRPITPDMSRDEVRLEFYLGFHEIGHASNGFSYTEYYALVDGHKADPVEAALMNLIDDHAQEWASMGRWRGVDELMLFGTRAWFDLQDRPKPLPATSSKGELINAAAWIWDARQRSAWNPLLTAYFDREMADPDYAAIAEMVDKISHLDPRSCIDDAACWDMTCEVLEILEYDKDEEGKGGEGKPSDDGDDGDGGESGGGDGDDGSDGGDSPTSGDGEPADVGDGDEPGAGGDGEGDDKKFRPNPVGGQHGPSIESKGDAPPDGPDYSDTTYAEWHDRKLVYMDMAQPKRIPEEYSHLIGVDKFHLEHMDRFPAHSNIQRHISRMLTAKLRTRWSGNQETGRRRKASHMWRIKHGRTDYRMDRTSNVAREGVFTLLVDYSGSMLGRKAALAIYAALMFSETLSGLRVKHEVVGFTDKDKPINILFKKYDENVTTRVLRDRMLGVRNAWGNNADGVSLTDVYCRIKKRKEHNKTIIVFSDGMPCSSAAHGNYKEYTHLREVCTMIDADPTVYMHGIGIESRSVTEFYKHNTVLEDSGMLEEACLSLVRDRILANVEAAA